MIDTYGGLAILVLLIVGFVAIVIYEIRYRLEIERRIITFGRTKPEGFSITDIRDHLAGELPRFPKVEIEETLERLQARGRISGKNPFWVADRETV